MESSSCAKTLKVALFVLVPTAYLSMPLWRPYDSYGPLGRQWGTRGAALIVLMAAVFTVSLFSWKSCHLVAALGLAVCLLWLAVLLLPVL